MVVGAIKWHGGKHYLAKKIIALMPPHIHYVEPYFGGGWVLLNKDPEGVSEVVNDLHWDLVNFWSVLSQPRLFDKFKRRIEGVPFCESHFNICKLAIEIREPQTATEATDFDENRVRAAIGFFVRCRQSRAGQMKEFATLSRTRTRRGMNEQASAWLTAVEGLPEIHDRLRRVVILCRDALDVIRQQDGDGTLFYLDPPYLHETRSTAEVYQHEMVNRDHANLLLAITNLKGKFLLSGYRSRLYDDHAKLHGWHRTEFDLPNNAAAGKTKRRMTECVWSNFKP